MNANRPWDAIDAAITAIVTDKELVPLGDIAKEFLDPQI